MGREAVYVWSGLDAPRLEIARVELDGNALRARGTQVGVAYELRYELEPAGLRAEIVSGPRLELELGEADFFDLGYSPLFNTLPIRTDGLVGGGEPREYVMRWVDVPSLEVHRSEQRYAPLGDERVRFTAGSFTADLELDEEGFVVRYPGLATREYPPPP